MRRTRASAPRTPGIAHGPTSDYAALLVVDPAHYAIANELARGGMGRIVRAYDRRLGRPVAIKELLAGHDDARFEREARITARLAHPAIVAIHEAGRWPSGEPFFAMKLVSGTSLDKRIAETKSFAERLALIPSVTAVVDALAYAHSERVIHRDLKPANVLVGTYGETVVIDWGLAKDLAAPDDDVSVGPFRGEASGETVAGAVMGTPAYMPPEQAEGEPVDERADVYALGALLYQVLAGVAPYEGKNTQDVLARVLAGPPPALAKLAPTTPIDLVAIVDKAMARDPAQRFPSAREMADELRRFQTGQLVTSHEYTFGELVRRWLHRYRAPVAVGAIAFVTLAIVGVASVAKIVAETHRADREAADARARADRGTLEHARALLDTDPSQAIAVLNELSPDAPEWSAARTIVADAEARGTAHVLRSNGEPIRELAFSADGAYLAARTDLGLVVWDVSTGVKTRLLGAGKTFRTIAWAGHDLLNIDREGTLARWHPFAGGNDKLDVYDANYHRLSPNGHWLAFGDANEDVKIVELATKRTRHTRDGVDFDWLDDDTLGMWNRRQDTLETFSARTGAETDIEIPHTDAFDPVGAFGGRAGKLFVSPSSNQLIRVGGGELPSGHATNITSLAVLPDGRVATASTVSGEQLDPAEVIDSADLAVTIADGTQDVAKLVGHRASITALTVSRAGVLASGDMVGEVRIWERTPIATRQGRGRSLLAFLEPDRGALIEMRVFGNATRTELASGRVTSIERTFSITDGALAPHSEQRAPADDDLDAAESLVHAKRAVRWLTIDQRGAVWAWDVASGARQICDTSRPCNVGKIIAIGGDGRLGAMYLDRFDVFDPSTGQIFDHGGGPSVLAVSDDSTLIAMAQNHAGEDNLALELGRTDREIRLPARKSPATALAFSGDGTQLAVAVDAAIELVSTTPPYSTGRVLAGHQGVITRLEYLPDGRLVSSSIDHTVRIWDVTDGSSHVLRLPARIATVDVLGDRAVTTSDDHALRLWDIPNETARTLLGHDDAPMFGGIAADGTIVGVDRDGRVSRYRDAAPYGEAALRTWIAMLTNL
jgi:WD40 repeat protein